MIINKVRDVVDLIVDHNVEVLYGIGLSHINKGQLFGHGCVGND
jgi:hypothetical protein